MRKPRVTTRCVANNYAAPGERIVEFSNGARSAGQLKGGLISLRTTEDGRLLVQLYQLDQEVHVTISRRA